METIKITPPKIARAIFNIEGTAPLMTARFSKKAELMEGMKAGSTTQTKRARPKRDFDADAQAAAYIAHEGWYGIHAAAFRNAAISACRLVGFKMTMAKLSIFTEADGWDREEGIPLVRIVADPPAVSVMPARNANNSVDMRARPMWAPGWRMAVRMAWDEDQFTVSDITNLLARVGAQVGIGEGRPDSRSSAGLGYGLFVVHELANIRKGGE